MKRLTLLMLFSMLATVALVRAPELGAEPEDYEVRVLGQTQWLAGGPAAVRVVTYRPDGSLVAVPVRVELRQGDKVVLAEQGGTDARGTFDAALAVPADLDGAYQLAVVTGSEERAKTQQATVSIRKEARLYLTTDKPLYQPGQIIHLRSLALRYPSLEAVDGAALTLEVEDPKGNKVFKKKLTTSRFGVASTEFELASEVNMGEYHVKAYLEGDAGKAEADRSVSVKRYTLPKYKVSLKTDKDFYLAGEEIRGTVQADYFFGKPVAQARVEVILSSFDVSYREAARLSGTTDASGAYAFTTRVPDYLTGQPLEKGNAFLQWDVRLEDSAQQKQELASTVPVVASPIAIETYAEAGELAPGLPNRVYVLTSYPDGSPARTELSVRLAGEEHQVASDASGFAEVEFQLPENSRELASTADLYGAVSEPVPIAVEARDAQGNKARTETSLQKSKRQQQVLIRPKKALYRVGEVLEAEIASTRRKGSVYVDLLRNNQTLATRSIAIDKGRGTFRMELTPDLYGQLTLHAYTISPGSDVIRDTRKIFVQPAADLVVEVRPDADTFKPGGEATLKFLVRTPGGAPRAAVLGVDVVDESLFALAEKKPGLERVYFLLEKELMEPRYEVHGFTAGQALLPEARQKQDSQNLARALLAELPEPAPYTLSIDTFEAKLQQMPARFAAVHNALGLYQQRHSTWPRDLDQLFREGLLKQTDSRDVWGREMVLVPSAGQAQPLVVSRGADGELGTDDDLNLQKCYTQLYKNGREDKLEGNLRFRDAAGAGGPMMADTGQAAPAPVARRQEEASGKKAQGAPVRVREWFPETLYTHPQVITDGAGEATLKVPLADSITTWRLTAFASSVRGEMGNTTAGIRVFQDFFIDLDLPVALTQNDRVSVPVAVYNYLPQPQTVTITLQPGDWFRLDGEASRSLTLQKGEVTSVSFPITVDRVGHHTFTVLAQGSQMSDAIKKPIEVTPDGQELTQTFSDRLQGQVRSRLVVPQGAIDGSQKLMVTIYPGIFSQLVDGLDSILRMPGGCFEQTSSTTYPNVLVMDYLTRTRKANPEIQMKAEGYINQGYQRLLTFEVQGGGFSVFGQAPANPILTSYGLMEFADMAKVHEVDPALIARTKQWLIAQQRQDGSWAAGHEGFYAEGWQNVPNSALISTAYVTWGLLEAGERGPAVQKAVAYLTQHMGEAVDAYQWALLANAMVSYDPASPATAAVLKALVAAAQQNKDMAWWSTGIQTAAYGTGQPADIETTALAALALVRSGQHHNLSNKAITYLVRGKDSFGTWSSTQATVLALKAMLASVDKATERVNSTVAVSVNGNQVETVKLTNEDFDVFRQLDLSRYAQKGENVVELSFSGEGQALYQVTGRYHLPWKLVPEETRKAPLSISVDYDRTALAVDDTATATVKARNLTDRRANMVMLDIGVPPGFDVVTEDLTGLVERRAISRFSVAARQLIVYLEGIDAGQELSVSYRVRARYPLRAQAPESRVYEYYNPEREAKAPPVLMQVQ
ncbi:MAG: hypothetical protein HY319_27910 [Armatimonadetes bacterium]|nr:hypothetical protein [Armatimonadota bacterium]